MPTKTATTRYVVRCSEYNNSGYQQVWSKRTTAEHYAKMNNADAGKGCPHADHVVIAQVWFDGSWVDLP